MISTLSSGPLVVGTGRPPAALGRCLERARRAVAAQGIELVWDTERRPPFFSYLCRFSPASRSSEGVACMAGALAELVRRDLRNTWPRRMLRRRVDRLPPLVAASIVAQLKGAWVPPRDALQAEIAAILAQWGHFTPEGFVRFRLQGALEAAEREIHSAIRRVCAAQEYCALVAALRNALAQQPTQLAVAQVVRRGYGGYALYDADGQRLPSDFLDGPIVAQPLRDPEHEELLISALLQLAPTEIVCHFPPVPGQCSLLRDVFTDRLRFCPGCPACAPDR